MTRRFITAFILLIFTVGCSVLPVPTEQVSSNSSVDCINHYDYVITKDNIDQPISPYKIYFHLDSQDEDAKKKIRLIVQLNDPIQSDGVLLGKSQIFPTFYQWHLVFAQDRNWYVDFFREEDGFSYSTLELSQEEWRASSLCVFFKDVNSDGTDDNLMFRILVEDFVTLPPTPEDKISTYLQAIAKKDKETADSSWYIFDNAYDENQIQLLKSRREQITHQLLDAEILPDYSISWLEGWAGGSAERTNIGSAWLNRFTVQLVTHKGEKLKYIFDVANKEYDTVPDYYHRDWVIVDVYPDGEQPYFWKTVSKP